MKEESDFGCDLLGQIIVQEKVYQSAIGYEMDRLPDFKFIGIVELPIDIPESSGFPLLPKLVPTDGSEEDDKRFVYEKRIMKEWHQKQLTKYQQIHM